MIRQGVWVNVNQSSVPEGRKLIGSKWVFKENETDEFGQDKCVWAIVKYLGLILATTMHQLEMT